MFLKNNGITDIESWKKAFPPMGGERQWKDGRSAKELAKYMTANYPAVPAEIEKTLSNFTSGNTSFEWYGEYVTKFDAEKLGKGEGRNHDAAMWNSDIFIGIEGKADEPLGSECIGEAYEKAGENKRKRINGLINMLFGDSPDNHKDIRYQLVTAGAAVLIEASKRNLDKALLLVIVFKKDGCYSEEKINLNNRDIEIFLKEAHAQNMGDYWKIPSKFGQDNNIDLLFGKIEITL